MLSPTWGNRVTSRGSGIFPGVIWAPLVRLRLLVGLKILRPCFSNCQKSGFSLVTTNLKILITYYNKHSLLTHTSHISCSSARLELPTGCRLGRCLSHVSSHSKIQAEGTVTTGGRLFFRGGRRSEEWEKSHLLRASAPNWDTDAKDISHSYSTLMRPSTRSVGWKGIYCPLGSMGKSTGKWMFLQGQSKKLKTLILFYHTNQIMAWKKKFTTTHTNFTRCPQFIGNNINSIAPISIMASFNLIFLGS